MENYCTQLTLVFGMQVEINWLYNKSKKFYWVPVSFVQYLLLLSVFREKPVEHGPTGNYTEVFELNYKETILLL